MPVYFFNLFNDAVLMDDEGVELADNDAARVHAMKEARTMAADSVRQGHLIASHQIEYLDENRTCIGTVRFDEAVDIKP